jgi:DNA-directed RNA polymerase specialized sigma24 family protein
MPAAIEPNAIEALIRRSWFALLERCRRLLPAEAAEEAARLSLARLVQRRGAAAEGEWMTELYAEATGLCAERLAGHSGRDAVWRWRLEQRQGAADAEEQESAAAEAVAERAAPEPLRAEPPRELWPELLDRLGPDSRATMIYRHLDGLKLDSIARLTGLSRERLEARIERLTRAADSFFDSHGEPPLVPPEPTDCADAFERARLLADEREGLDAVRDHLEHCPTCARAIESGRQRQREQLDAETVAGVRARVEQALERLAFAPRRRRLGPGAALLALGLALLAGLLLWSSLPAAPDPQDDPLARQGGYGLEVLLARPDGDRPLQPGERLAGGSRLRFRLWARKPMVVGLAALPESGPAERIRNRERDAFAVPPGQPIEPGVTYAIGDEPGLLRIFALFCPLATPLPYLPQTLEYAYRQGPDGKRDLARDFKGAPRHCRLRSVLLRLSGGRSGRIAPIELE